MLQLPEVGYLQAEAEFDEAFTVFLGRAEGIDRFDVGALPGYGLCHGGEQAVGAFGGYGDAGVVGFLLLDA